MWSLRKNEKELEPLVFSNGKSQKDVVKEVLDAIGEGHKIIFIKGMCGTGKSAIALNIARNFGRASIVVPIKSLQEQYAKDYTEQMSVLNKENKEKLKIASIVGRNNFQCRFLKENANLVEGSFRERNILLDDIFGGKSVRKNKEKEKSCDNSQLPCKIEIKEKNIYQLKEYLKKIPT
jgi:deoxyadenosine/deoxycytidine kinase